MAFSAANLEAKKVPKHSASRRRGRHRKLPPISPVWSTVVATVSTIMMTLDITIVLVALPEISADLNLSLTGGQWVINAYSLAFASLLLSVGSMSDILGRRTLFLVGHFLFLGASLGCTFADTETLLIFWRAVQGIGGALVFGTSIPLLSDAFEPEAKSSRTRAIALLMGGAALSSALGPLVGGVLVQYGSWEWIFIINIPVGIFVICATLMRVPEVRHAHSEGPEFSPPPMDVLAVMLSAGMFFLLNYGIIMGAEKGWTNWVVSGSLLGSAVLLLILIWSQLAKRERAMIDVRLFVIPSFSAVTFASFAMRMFSFGMMPFIILWLSGKVGLTALEIGYVSTVMAVPIVLFAVVGLRLATIIRVGFVMAMGMVMVAGGLLLGLMVNTDSSWPSLVPMYLLIGVGTGIALPHLMDLAVSVVPESRTGTASGIANTALPLGTSFGVAVYGSYLASVIQDRLNGASEKITEAAEAGQFALVEKYAPNFAAPALEGFIDALHGIFVVAAALAVFGAIICAVFIKEENGATNNELG